ncbi:GlsB/YeaQ/YmgE family stress response membrane protein [Cellulosimicrobium protaetiae]|uniref:GlsB/YeaQ/YmgE family stress response membrane protein n=1 Tax=Cellulosimicrobium protaetiae TaxID=2587808 RepID=A0A6M5U919_9MICO|nr:GlsB/YeaQ/YmgE family stress response membrane protein [Cellulosimicrobium protaetiae]QJW34986.1 GlsB/YeaQ/YmgE family stress response membrane protein [Cellulosimicrobium protaetiae]
MGWLAYIVLGLVAGLIARAVLPGKQTSSLIVTILLGILGALLGGWLGSVLFGTPLGDLGDFRTWILAILGSLITLGVYGAVTKGSRRRA